jgi:hypothetical protein
MRMAMVVAAATALAACDPGTITIPVRTCVLKGTALSLQNDLKPTFLDLFSQVNEIWHPANIVWLGCCAPIPVIDDPDLTVGKPGEVTEGNGLVQSQEMADAQTACNAAWDRLPNGNAFAGGTVVIVVSQILQENGLSESMSLGQTTVPAQPPNLCVHPRVLNASHVKDLHSFVMEPAGLAARGANGAFVAVFAHELGHTLLLYHGNGLDDDMNGLEPPAVGPRLFDQTCDGPEFVNFDSKGVGHSLMDVAEGSSTVLTPLQIELAREAALVVPSHQGGP